MTETNPHKKLSPGEIKRLKGLGCLKDKRYNDIFNIRTLTGNGKLAADDMAVILEAAKRFGNGEIALTVRLSVEIQGVPYDQIEPLRSFLKDHGIKTGGTGNKLRPVVSCKGTTCQYGLIDTYELSQQINDRILKGHIDLKLPHKFKIAVGGCPNNCAKINLNDIGIMGQQIPGIDPGKCRGCGLCRKACPFGIPEIHNKKVSIDLDTCKNCGRCIRACPFGALTPQVSGYRLYLGGRWGKEISLGHPMEVIVESEEEVMDLIECVISFYKDEGLPGERFAQTIDRLGWEKVQKRITGGKSRQELSL